MVGQKPGFLTKIFGESHKFSQKPGFFLKLFDPN